MHSFPILSAADEHSLVVKELPYAPMLFKAFYTACRGLNRHLPIAIDPQSVHIQLGFPDDDSCINLEAKTGEIMHPPSGSVHFKDRLILINPRIFQQEAPGFVLQYIFWHELTHLAKPPLDGEWHHEEFMYYERLYRFHKRAVDWLEAHRFPTVD